jgi:hypothetical protein
MTIEKIMEVFAPQLEVGLTRINAFKDPEQRDEVRVDPPWRGSLVEILGWETGIEPATVGATVRCSTG